MSTPNIVHTVPQQKQNLPLPPHNVCWTRKQMVQHIKHDRFVLFEQSWRCCCLSIPAVKWHVWKRKKKKNKRKVEWYTPNNTNQHQSPSSSSTNNQQSTTGNTNQQKLLKDRIWTKLTGSHFNNQTSGLIYPRQHQTTRLFHFLYFASRELCCGQLQCKPLPRVLPLPSIALQTRR